jgi:hypothetical protein
MFIFLATEQMSEVNYNSSNYSAFGNALPPWVKKIDGVTEKSK